MASSTEGKTPVAVSVMKGEGAAAGRQMTNTSLAPVPGRGVVYRNQNGVPSGIRRRMDEARRLPKGHRFHEDRENAR